MYQNEHFKDIETNENEIKDSVENADQTINEINDNLKEDVKNTNDSTHSIQITDNDPDCSSFIINNVPKDITVKELSKLIINSSEFSLKSDSFTFTEDDNLLFDDDFIRSDDIKLVYLEENDDDRFFTLFLLFHILPFFIRFISPYPVEIIILLYLIMTLFFGFLISVKRKLIIQHAKSIFKKIMTCYKLLFLFFYSMLPFFNADNL